MRLALSTASLALLLAGCGGGGDDATSISIRSKSGEGNTTVASADGKSGEVSIDTPVFSGSLKLPKLHLDADDFDLNGVDLYPGSTISAINIDAHDDADSGDRDRVHVRFQSPAGVDTVREYFRKNLTGTAGYTLHDEDGALVGTTDDGDPFRLTLKAVGRDRAAGDIVMQD